jgi:hypothetical protein
MSTLTSYRNAHETPYRGGRQKHKIKVKTVAPRTLVKNAFA